MCSGAPFSSSGQHRVGVGDLPGVDLARRVCGAGTLQRLDRRRRPGHRPGEREQIADRHPAPPAGRAPPVDAGNHEVGVAMRQRGEVGEREVERRRDRTLDGQAPCVVRRGLDDPRRGGCLVHRAHPGARRAGSLGASTEIAPGADASARRSRATVPRRLRRRPRGTRASTDAPILARRRGSRSSSGDLVESASRAAPALAPTCTISAPIVIHAAA